jgi:phosphoribosylformimino-5-aminoimidazole carboxamide ribotide isomerase
MKIIPAIDLMEGKVVRLYKGDPNKKTIYSENPLEIAKKWESAGADMIHLVDLDATLGSGSNFDSLKNIAESVKIPVQVAGGFRNEKIIEEALKFATRVVIGTLAFKDKTALDRLLATYGSEKLVISVDHNDGKIVTNGWKETTSLELVSMVKELVKNGFTEFLSTSINRDGTLQGPDVKWLSSLSGKFFQINNVNVIASGGISNIGDVMSVKKLNPFGVILGKALYENQVTIEEAKMI